MGMHRRVESHGDKGRKQSEKGHQLTKDGHIREEQMC